MMVGWLLMAVTSNHIKIMRRNFEFKEYHSRYSKEGRDLKVPTLPEISSLCTKVVKLPYLFELMNNSSLTQQNPH